MEIYNHRLAIGVDEEGRRVEQDLKKPLTNEIRTDDFSDPSIYMKYLQGKVFTHIHIQQKQRDKLINEKKALKHAKRLIEEQQNDKNWQKLISSTESAKQSKFTSRKNSDGLKLKPIQMSRDVSLPLLSTRHYSQSTILPSIQEAPSKELKKESSLEKLNPYLDQSKFLTERKPPDTFRQKLL